MSALGGRASLRRGGFLGRLGMGLVDQVLSSTSNFVSTLVAARYLDKAAFGAYAFAIVAYTMNLLIVRALCSEAILVRPGEGERQRERRGSMAVGSAFWVGLVLGVGYAVAGLVVHGELRWALIALGVFTPGLMVQDTMRYVAFGQVRARSAVINDGSWLAAQAVVLVSLIQLDRFGPAAILIGWGATGTMAGLLQMRIDRIRARVGRGFGWIRENRDLSLRYLADMISGQGASLLASYVLAIVAGVAAVGSIRGAQTLFGPVNVVLLGSNIVLVPEGRRLVKQSTRKFLAVCIGSALGFAALAATTALVFLYLPDEIGTKVLGSTWTGARSVMVPVGLASVAGGLVAGALAGLRSLAAADALLRTRLITTPVALLLPIVGALVADEEGLAWGIALSVFWNTLWFWITFKRTLDRHDPTSAVDEGDHEPIGVLEGVDGIDPLGI